MIKPKAPPLREPVYARIPCYEVIIFVFLVAEFLFLASIKTLPSAPFVVTHYLISYEYGFVARGLVGAGFSVLTDSISIRGIFFSAVCVFLFLIVLLSMLLGRILRTSTAENRPVSMLFVALFLASPLSVTYVLGFHFGRLDVYWILLTLLALAMMKHRVLRWFVPLLCASAVLIHQGYVLTYMPGLMIPIVYEIYASKYSKSVMAVFGLCCVTIITLFFYLQYAPVSIPFGTAVDYADHLSAKAADFEAYAPMLQQEFFTSASEWAQGIIFPILKLIALPLGLTLFVFSVPLIVIFGFIWTRSLALTSNPYLKVVFLLCLFAPVIFIPAALAATDWDRWWAAVLNNQFIFLFYILYSKEVSVTRAAKAVGDFFERRMLVLLLLLIFTNSLTYSRAASIIFPLVMDPDGAGRIFFEYVNNTIYGLVPN